MKQMKKPMGFLAALLAVLLVSTPVLSASSALAYDIGTSFVFSDSGITASGEDGGYSIDGTALTISAAGTYVLSGSCADGSVTVKKGTTGVTLVLKGLTLTSADTAPISCNKSSEVTIYVEAGTVNTLTDSAENNDDNYPDNENAENAVIKCKDGSRVTICGSGTLNIVSNGKNGIKSGATTEEEGEAWLVIRDVTLNVTAAVNDGINAEASLIILSGAVTVSAADDGIHSDYLLEIGAEGTDGPVILIQDSEEGLEGAEVNIRSGNITVHAKDDGINAANSDLAGYSFSCTIYGGTVYVDAGGDGIDSNGTLTLAGGTVEVYSAESNDNSPLDSDGALTLSGGTVLAVGMSGMDQIPNSADQPWVSFGGMSMGMPGGMGDQGDRPEMPENAGGPMGGEMPGTPGGMGTAPGMYAASSISISAGDVLCILDSDGTVLCTATAVRNANYVLFSSEKLTAGETYTLTVNGTAVSTAQAATEGGGNMGPGGQGQPPEGMPGGTAHTFADVSESDWYYRTVQEICRSGLMVGTSDTTFSPTASASRAMAAAILYRMAGSPEVTDTASFSDVKDGAWYAQAVAWAAENGIFSGMPDGSFHPDDAITREQLVTVLYRFLQSQGRTLSASGDLSQFRDADRSGDWAAEALSWAIGANVLRGNGDRTLNPDGTTTRAELAQILLNYMRAAA